MVGRDFSSPPPQPLSQMYYMAGIIMYWPGVISTRNSHWFEAGECLEGWNTWNFPVSITSAWCAYSCTWIILLSLSFLAWYCCCIHDILSVDYYLIHRLQLSTSLPFIYFWKFYIVWLMTITCLPQSLALMDCNFVDPVVITDYLCCNTQLSLASSMKKKKKWNICLVKGITEFAFEPQILEAWATL